VVVGAILLAFPFILPSNALATDILIMGLFALGYNFIFGHMGKISFGHAMFFGLGSYTVGFLVLHANIPNWAYLLTIPAGMIVAGGIAYLVGYACLKKVGAYWLNPAYFALTTLAFAQMIYYIFLIPLEPYDGGYDGMVGIAPPIIGSIELYGANYYYFVFIIFVVCIFLAKKIADSPFGRMLHAIRENEERVLFLGYDAFKFKHYSFILSGVVGGLAGALQAFRLLYCGTEDLHWLLSGEVIIMALLGGMRSFYGPLLGAFIYMFFKDFIVAYTPEWMLFVAIIVIFVVLFLPEGVVPPLQRYLSRRLKWKYRGL
jgi:branched-chain amino acid transport system permease protein